MSGSLRTRWLKLPKGREAHSFALPEDFAGQNVLVEVVAAGRRAADRPSQALYEAGDFSLHLQLSRVRHGRERSTSTMVSSRPMVLAIDSAAFARSGR